MKAISHKPIILNLVFLMTLAAGVSVATGLASDRTYVQTDRSVAQSAAIQPEPPSTMVTMQGDHVAQPPLPDKFLFSIGAQGPWDSSTFPQQ
jgi:hypothetical protein